VRTAHPRFMQARRHRQPLSLVGALLYAVCAIVLPSLHLGLHRADHEHRYGGLQLLHTGLGGHHALPPHSHGTNLFNDFNEAANEAANDREPQDAGAAASRKTGGQISLLSAQLHPVSWVFAVQETATQCAPPHSNLLGAEGRAPGGSPAPEPGHGSGSLAHFASAFVAAFSSIRLPFAGLLYAQMRYTPRAECAPRSLIMSAKRARSPPAPVTAI